LHNEITNLTLKEKNIMLITQGSFGLLNFFLNSVINLMYLKKKINITLS